LRSAAVWDPTVESVSTDVAVPPAVNITVGLESEHVGAAEMVSEPE
jgi:hypothetical protein